MSEAWVPTVNDLRVKMCYICREEESSDRPENPPRPWTHPCNCTLIAHESCLLHWIQTSQQDRSRAANALKCPQCSAMYELESENPFILRFLEAGNRTLSFMGKLVTVASVATVAATFASGIYIISTGYGAYALQQFLGKEMYDLLLTDDPANWPWHAYINLPLIPLSLILSRTPVTSNILPIIPVLLAWPNSSPVVTRERVIHREWLRPFGGLSTVSSPQFGGRWPPSPALLGLVVFPLIRAMYRVYWRKLTNRVLKTTSVSSPADEWRVRDGLPRVRLRFGLGEPPEQAPARQERPAGANADPNAPADVAAIAEQTIQISSTSLGRLIGGALIIPEISNIMGSILYKLSAHSSLLRSFLAIRPSTGKAGLYPEWWEGPMSNWEGMGIASKVGLTLKIVLGQWWAGSRTWAESDPVWWRNSIGLGIFVVAKDCAQLIHLWLAKRELETRRVKNKSFEGVDIRELDLLPRAPML